jgi:hypothetical protein
MFEHVNCKLNCESKNRQNHENVQCKMLRSLQILILTQSMSKRFFLPNQ